jgi:hypothetical protein
MNWYDMPTYKSPVDVARETVVRLKESQHEQQVRLDNTHTRVLAAKNALRMMLRSELDEDVQDYLGVEVLPKYVQEAVDRLVGEMVASIE